MVKIAIVEDEDLYADQLNEFINKYAGESHEIIRQVRFYDGDEIAEKYDGSYDIILMDIQMKFMDGMSAAEEIRKRDRNVIIMFITNRVDYAIRGYEVDALDYIVKPVSYFSFARKLERAISRIPDKEDV
ncbi:MAG TPA: DNA-binding response regulator, partial [Lachnospiraceae bacterium]|nr:DNA-binding response regulator [Lachnospiraceae bacterium]